MDVILITGTTGLLGAYLLRDILYRFYGNKNIKIVALARSSKKLSSKERVFFILNNIIGSDIDKFCDYINVIEGDITKDFLGLSKDVYYDLVKKTICIYHSAALCEFNVHWEVISKVNVEGTRNILEFSLQCRDHTKEKFIGIHHISTIAIGGTIKGILYEDDLELEQDFNNTYERSKFEAERLIRLYRDRYALDISVYRPAIIIGDSVSGYTNNFKMIYQPLHLFSLGIFKEIPCWEGTVYSFCPVDYVSKAIVGISSSMEKADNMTYHIINPNKIYLHDFIDAAARFFKFNPPKLVNADNFNYGQWDKLRYSLLSPYIPYFTYKLFFDNRRAKAALDNIYGSDFNWPVIDENILFIVFNYCAKCGFIKIKK